MMKFVVIDGNSLANRAFYALPGLTTSSGQSTGAVLGFANMIFRILDEERPDFMAVAFDRAAPTFRHLEFDGYKAKRKKMPDELASQLPLIKELVTLLGIPICELDGFEADDVIGTLSRLAEEGGIETLIVTGDRDALQLVSDRTRALLTRKGISELESYDAKAVKERFGIDPPQMIDVKSLMGDASDNIPGVHGIGEKTAFKLIGEFGDLDGVIRNLDMVKPQRFAELIRANEETARLSKRLATIDRNVPIEVSLDACKLGEIDYAGLVPFLRRLEFKSLLGRLEDKFPEMKAIESKSLALSKAGALPGDGALSEGETLPGDGTSAMGEGAVERHARCELILSSEALRTLALELKEARSLALAVLVNSRGSMGGPMSAGLLGIAVMIPEGPAYYIPMGHAYEGAPGIPEDAAIDVLKPVLEDPGIPKVMHDAKPQLIALRRRGVALRGLAFDSMIASYLIDPSVENHSIARVARMHLGEDIPSVADLFQQLGRGRTPGGLAAADISAVGECAAAELSAILRLRESLEGRIAVDGMGRLFCDVEMPLVEVLAGMEMAGVAIDVEGLKALSLDFARRIEELAGEIYSLAGEEFNVNSPKQLGAVLFEKLSLPKVKKTKTGYSTDAEVLEALSFFHPIAAKVLEYRELIKLKGTYVDALPALINPETGRVHTTFNQTVTATGRLSSSDPNLQNIPIRKEEGKKIRQVFVPGEEGWLILSADYSQIELRVLAHFAGDRALVDAFRNEEDIHARTAAEVYGVPIEAVTPQMRARAKAVNFGIVYGISDWGLARGTNMTQEEARSFIERYFEHYGGVKDYLEGCVRKAREDGYVTTLLGRRRYLPDLHSPKVALRKFAERTAMNTPIQGSAADIIKLAMVAVDRELQKRSLASRMILQVHDELVFEVPREELGEVAGLVKEIMEGAVELDVPLRAEVVAGANWLDMAPVSPGH